jgi:hypothetical protein
MKFLFKNIFFYGFSDVYKIFLVFLKNDIKI